MFPSPHASAFATRARSVPAEDPPPRDLPAVAGICQNCLLSVINRSGIVRESKVVPTLACRSLHFHCTLSASLLCCYLRVSQPSFQSLPESVYFIRIRSSLIYPRLLAKSSNSIFSENDRSDFTISAMALSLFSRGFHLLQKRQPLPVLGHLDRTQHSEALPYEYSLLFLLGHR